MLLIFVPKLTNRLGYTINVVMRNILQTEFAITVDPDTFRNHPEAKLCYDSHPLDNCDAIFIKARNLLFETTIEEQECQCFEYNGIPVLFPCYGRNTELPFDPFAAIFYMISRYEEYLPHRNDIHGRFLATESIAYKNGFLQMAVVDRWALMLKDIILKHYPDTVFSKRIFNFVQTIDIDSAYCYLNKGIFRTTLGFMRDGLHRHDKEMVRHRMRVLRGKEHDPFDTFDYVIELNQKLPNRFSLLFFTLLGDYGIYDKPISSYNNEFRQLLQHLGDYAKIGIHCSYYSTDEPDNARLFDGVCRPARVPQRNMLDSAVFRPQFRPGERPEHAPIHDDGHYLPYAHEAIPKTGHGEVSRPGGRGGGSGRYLQLHIPQSEPLRRIWLGRLARGV